jgi:hypothetical protein
VNGDGDPHVVAERSHHKVHPEVGTLQSEGRLEADQGRTSPGILSRARHLRLGRDGTGHPVQREVAGDFVPILAQGANSGAFEPDHGKLCGVEEVGASQMVVAPLVVGVDRFGS